MKKNKPKTTKTTRKTKKNRGRPRGFAMLY
jgi:hypothetical protein